MKKKVFHTILAALRLLLLLAILIFAGYWAATIDHSPGRPLAVVGAVTLAVVVLGLISLLANAAKEVRHRSTREL